MPPPTLEDVTQQAPLDQRRSLPGPALACENDSVTFRVLRLFTSPSIREDTGGITHGFVGFSHRVSRRSVSAVSRTPVAQRNSLCREPQVCAGISFKRQRCCGCHVPEVRSVFLKTVFFFSEFVSFIIFTCNSCGLDCLIPIALRQSSKLTTSLRGFFFLSSSLKLY